MPASPYSPGPYPIFTGRLQTIAQTVADTIGGISNGPGLWHEFRFRAIVDAKRDLQEINTSWACYGDVLGRKTRRELLNRGGDLLVDYEVDVILRARLEKTTAERPNGNLEDGDNLREFQRVSDAVQVYYFKNPLADLDVSLVESSTDSVGVADWYAPFITQLGIFATVITLTFRGFE